MINEIRDEVKYLVMEWWKYMDTNVPSGVDRKLFTHLKYANMNRIKKFMNNYPQVDIGLLEKHALMEYLKKSDEEIIKDLNFYYGGVLYEDIKGNGRNG